MSKETIIRILEKAESFFELRFLSIVLACMILIIIVVIALNIYGTTKAEQREIAPKEVR